MSYQDPYAPQDIYAQQQQLGKADASGAPAYTQPGAYAQPAPQPYAQPGAYPPPQQPYGQPGAYPPPQQPYGQPGAYPPPQQPYGQPGAYPPPQQPYGQPGAYAPQPNYVRMGGTRGANPWANRALISGVISIVLALITLFSSVGYAGLITGAFAIYRGITALVLANKIAGNPGRVSAILAIVFGVLAWLLVFLSFGLRGLTQA